jgi:teichuronic acid biosynthesis glycosyltransferase TuaC
MKNKKRILVIVGAIPCRNHIYSGIFTLNQIIELSKTGKYQLDVIFVRPMFPKLMNWVMRRVNKNILFLDRPIEGKRDGMEIHLIPYLYLPKLSTISMILTSYVYILLKRLQFDIIHSYFLLSPGYLGVKLGWLFKKPVVVTAMGSDVNLMLDGFARRKILKPGMIQKIMVTLRTADLIVAKSDYLRMKMIELGVPRDKVRVINNGVSKEKFHLLDLKKGGAQDGKKRIILYLGNLYAEKGLEELLQAIEILRRKRNDFSLWVIGDGLFKRQFSELIQRAGLEKFVRMEGQQPHEEIPRWINRSDVLCLPSHNEGFPNVLVEAIACGRPVVASDTGGIPEIVNDSKLGILVPPRDAEKLACALEEALEKEWDYGMIAKSGERFYWENIIPKFDDLYNELI